jgi:hypothetical protein
MAALEQLIIQHIVMVVVVEAQAQLALLPHLAAVVMVGQERHHQFLAHP